MSKREKREKEKKATKGRLAAAALWAAAFFLVAGAFLPAAALAGPTARSAAPLYDATRSKAKNPIIVGQSTLVRDDSGLSFSLRTSGLVPGNAYTVWIIIKQKAKAKADRMIAVNATGGVAFSRKQTFFAGRIGVGKVRDARGDRSAVRFGGNFFDPRGATVMFAIVNHGPLIPEMVHEQLTTRFGGRCSNAPGKKKSPGGTPCKSVQRSLPHKPGI